MGALLEVKTFTDAPKESPRLQLGVELTHADPESRYDKRVNVAAASAVADTLAS